MSKDLEFIVKLIANTVIENEQYFSELDGVVGDGDFGYSIARGFEIVLNEWATIDHSLPGNTLKGISMKIVGAVGGVSGTIWGTAFLRAGIALGTKPAIGREDVIALFRAAIEGIKKRGNADLGDKTLLDALIPAVDHPTNASQARPRCLHWRAQHWNVGCRRNCGGSIVRGRQQGLERIIYFFYILQETK
jgi:dihydroxyacetone kinase